MCTPACAERVVEVSAKSTSRVTAPVARHLDSASYISLFTVLHGCVVQHVLQDVAPADAGLRSNGIGRREPRRFAEFLWTLATPAIHRDRRG